MLFLCLNTSLESISHGSTHGSATQWQILSESEDKHHHCENIYLKIFLWSTCRPEIKSTTPLPKSKHYITHCIYCSCLQLLTLLLCLTLAQGDCSNHKGQDAGTLVVSMLCSSIWNHSQPITNSSFLAAYTVFLLSLSLSLSLSPSSFFSTCSTTVV